MQAYAEGFELMHKSRFPIELKEVAGLWNRGSVVRSWLCELAENAFAAEGNDLEALKGHVSDSGEGRWTIVDAIDHDVPTPVITASLYARFYSRGEGDYTHRVLAALRNQFGGHAVERAAGELSGWRSRRTPARREPAHGGARAAARSPPTTLVIFGATGDLAHRKLLPALYNLAHEGALPERFKLVGVARREKGKGDFRDEARGSIVRVLAPGAQRGGPRRAGRAGPLHRVELRRPGGLQGARGGARQARRGGRPAAEPRLLPLDRAGVLPRDRRAAQGGRAAPPSEGRRARDHREAVRHRPRLGARAAAASSRTRSASARSSASTTTWARRRSRT